MLFGERVADLTTRRQTVPLDHCANPTEFREYWKRNYGPTIAAYRFNKDQPERVEALDRDFLSFPRRGIEACGSQPLGRRVPAGHCDEALAARGV